MLGSKRRLNIRIEPVIALALLVATPLLSMPLFSSCTETTLYGKIAYTGSVPTAMLTLITDEGSWYIAGPLLDRLTEHYQQHFVTLRGRIVSPPERAPRAGLGTFEAWEIVLTDTTDADILPDR